jgi:hypothetical protein
MSYKFNFPLFHMQKLAKAAKDLKASRISEADYESMRRNMEVLHEALTRSQSFLSTIKSAVDPKKISEIFGNLHIFFLSITAVATSTSAATITVGLNIGRMISDRSYAVIMNARQIMSLPLSLRTPSQV